MCARFVGLAELILPSQRDAEEGTGGFVIAGSALLGLASSDIDVASTCGLR
jgi:hypothetical protein